MTAVEPALAGELDRDSAALSAYLEHGRGDLDFARERFLRVHADALHLELSEGRSRPLRLDELLERAAERVPGLVPSGGASNLRLARAVGERLARQAILSGREFVAGTPEGDLLCDETVERDEVDAAIDASVEALTSSGLVNAAANRRAMRVGQEPLELFRAYMATYCREQAACHLSPALVANLERNWNAKERQP